MGFEHAQQQPFWVVVIPCSVMCDVKSTSIQSRLFCGGVGGGGVGSFGGGDGSFGFWGFA